MSGSIILDIVIILFLVFFAIKGYIDGFLKTVLQFAGYLAAVVVAVLLSRFLGPFVAGLFREDIISSSVDKIGEGPVGDIGLTITQMLESLPAFLSSWILAWGSPEELALRLQTSSEQTTQQVAAVITDELVIPLIGALLQIIFFLVFFVAIMFLVRFIIKVSQSANDIPVLGTLNRIGGAGLGILKGIVISLAFLLLVGLVLSVTSDGQEIIDKTFLFGRLYELLPFKLA